MSFFRVLEGLPVYGPVAEAFSATGRGTHSEGLVVEFKADEDSPSWVGNFQPGWRRFNQGVPAPGSDQVLVVAGGQGHVIDARTRACLRVFGGGIEGIWSPKPGLVLVSDGISFEALGPSGTNWRSRRISWDGMAEIHVEGDELRGLAYAPTGPEDEWVPFRLDILTGEVTGGSFPPVLSG
jgi:hypothetical protein